MARRRQQQQSESKIEEQVLVVEVPVTVEPVKETIVSVIGFCRANGIKNAQQVYQMLGKDQVPEELIVRQQVGEKVQPFFKLEAATQWWTNRKAGHAAKKEAKASETVDQVIARFIDMANEVTKQDPEAAKLADLFAKVMKAQGGTQ